MILLTIYLTGIGVAMMKDVYIYLLSTVSKKRTLSDFIKFMIVSLLNSIFWPITLPGSIIIFIQRK